MRAFVGLGSATAGILLARYLDDAYESTDVGCRESIEVSEVLSGSRASHRPRGIIDALAART